MFYEVIPTKVFQRSAEKSSGILTYSSKSPLKSGQIVKIELGKKQIFGIVYQKSKIENPPYKIKEIISSLDLPPLPAHIIKAIFWLSEYYITPLPLVANMFIPSNLDKKRRETKACISKKPAAIISSPSENSENSKTSENPRPSSILPKSMSTPNHSQNTLNIPLNPSQKQALEAILSITTNTKLLHGVTGSGKTNIYIKMAENAKKQGLSTILLVPEIALTSQLVEIFNTAFPEDTFLIHSKQTESTRCKIWQEIISSTEKAPKIIIGPRSALCSPIKNLGLIIIDEAHEQAYYQESPPKYSAIRLASFIAKTNKIDCLLGTATPLVQDYYLAEKGNALVTLTSKAKNTAIEPQKTVINLKDRSLFTENYYFSDKLLCNIRENLENGHQTLIFHNRRGSAPLTICEQCGWQALCKNCLLPLTLHSDSYSLICHTCGLSESVPKNCKECGHPNIIHKGFGTKLLESELKKLFKNTQIARFDADNSGNSSLDKKFEQVKSGEIDILIGTQTIAKGLDLPLLKTVGVVHADSGLSLPDYSAEEKTFHLLTQVIGRVGRGHLEEANVFIQTYQPDHQVINTALNNDYLGFYHYLLEKRKKTHFPPFFYIAKVNIVQKTEKTAIDKIRKIYSILKDREGIYLSAPTPAFHEHTASGFNWQILIKSTSRKNLITAINSLTDFSNLRFTIDPPSLL